MFCAICGRNINQLGQDNVSPVPGYPACEECASESDFAAWVQEKQQEWEESEDV